MGYHSPGFNPTKGTLGRFSKIKEEFEELEDANLQGDKILELCELSDLIGAIESYVEERYDLSISDLKSFSDKTKSAFEEGDRA